MIASCFFMRLRKTTIAFILNKPYNPKYAQVANRLRAYDVISRLNPFRFKAEFYQPSKKYDIVIINRIFDDKLPELIRKLKKQGSIVGLDEVVNYINTEGNKNSYVNNYVSEQQVSRVHEVLKEVDFVIVPSQKLQSEYMKLHDTVFCIEDMVYRSIFKEQKKHTHKEQINLLYCGLAAKATELNQIREVLIKVHKKHNIQLLLITEEDPQLDIIPYKHVKYEQENIGKLMLEGDIKIAPRDLTNAYNRGHSSLKAAYPMAVGIPVVASPVPSYYNKGVLFAHTEEEWGAILTKLIESPKKRQYYGDKGKNEIQRSLSERKIIGDYQKIFKYLKKQRNES